MCLIPPLWITVGYVVLWLTSGLAPGWLDGEILNLGFLFLFVWASSAANLTEDPSRAAELQRLARTGFWLGVAALLVTVTILATSPENTVVEPGLRKLAIGLARIAHVISLILLFALLWSVSGRLTHIVEPLVQEKGPSAVRLAGVLLMVFLPLGVWRLQPALKTMSNQRPGFDPIVR